MNAVVQLEDMEREVCNLPLVFAEMFKDEINANDEREMYDGVKRILKKYSQDESALSIINEFTSAISGGASLEEILTITKDEAAEPTLASSVTVDQSCGLDGSEKQGKD
jgi:hypothetical protein